MKIEVDDEKTRKWKQTLLKQFLIYLLKIKLKKIMMEIQFYMRHCTILPNMKLMKKYMLNPNLKLSKKLKKKLRKKTMIFLSL